MMRYVNYGLVITYKNVGAMKSYAESCEVRSNIVAWFEDSFFSFMLILLQIEIYFV